MSSNKKNTSEHYLVGEGGISFVDLAIEKSEVTVLIGQPGMLVAELLSTTNLSIRDRFSYQSLACLASELHVEVYCGFSGLSQVPVELGFNKTPRLKIGVGPTAMYQNELRIRTKSGETLDDLIRKHLCKKGRRNLVFGLTPVFRESTGHHMHGFAPLAHINNAHA